jgi:hypothetical protein
MKRNSTMLGIVALATASASLTACAQMADTQVNGIGGVRRASELQCNQARRDYEAGVDNFSILEGRVPTSETELVPTYLRSASELMDISPDGRVVVQPGGGCD